MYNMSRISKGGMKVKRIAAFVLAIFIVAGAFCSCKKEEPPTFDLILADGYTLDGDTVRAHFYNADFVYIYEDIKASRGSVRLYADRSMEEYFDGEKLDLEDGENSFCLALTFRGEEKIYDVVIDNTMIVGLSAEVKYEKIYGVGDDFDRDTVSVTAELYAGGTREITDYEADCALDSEGEKRVKISCGGYVCYVTVSVSGDSVPTLDDNMTDPRGAVYEIKDGKAALSDGAAVSGYFIVPKKINYGGNEYSVCRISDYAFYENETITGISIGDIFVGEAALCGCTSLKTASVGDGAELSGYVFRDCTSLEKVVLPQEVTEIPDGFFSGCGRLTEVSLSDGVKRIGHQAFEGCAALGEMLFPQSLEYIGRRAFSGCITLCRAIGGISLSEIGDGAFAGCPALSVLAIPTTCSAGENIIKGSENCVIYSGKTSLAMYNAKKEGGRGQVISEDGITVLKCREEFLLGDEISCSDADILLYTDVYLGLVSDFEISCDLSAPGERRIKISYGKYTATATAYADYTVLLSGTMDEYGAEYSLDRASGTAALVKLPDNLSGKSFVVPTAVSDGERTFAVTKIATGAVTHPLLEKLLMHSDIKLIEDGAIRDCPKLSLIYCGAKSAKIGTGNFENIAENAVIMCDGKNSPVQQSALEKGLICVGAETDELYFVSRRGAKSTYAKDEKFDFSGYGAVYVAKGVEAVVLAEEQANPQYDFSKNGAVTISFGGKTAEITVTVN